MSNFKRKWFDKLNTSQIITLGFAGVIFVGGILLWLPWAAAPGEQTSFLDALFTAATSVCVTGLVTVTTATHWSLFGKIVILLLIQLGGLGIITAVTLILLIMRRRISLKNRRMIQESYNLEHVGGMVSIIRKVIHVTLAVEGLGAAAYSVCFVPDLGWKRGIGNAIFTAVSSFCNAGIDILGENSLAPYVNHVGINCITMLLIISGGLGFTVWGDLGKGMKKIVREKHSIHYAWKGLTLHSKVAIVSTVSLVMVGTICFLLFEYSNPETIGNFSFGHKVLASAFQSVTTRTAGFLTIDQSAFTDTSTVVTVLLMLIGGSPMGTAGGMKTTTVVILIMTVGAFRRGKSDVEIFHRKISGSNIQAAIVVVCMGLAVLVVGILGISCSMDVPLDDVVFEVASALGTAGLTRGITPSLNGMSKVIIIICMYLGRIGPITLAAAITIRAKKVNNRIHLAEERILIG